MIILGLAGGLGHDAAACLVRNGQLVAMAEEERFVRTKRARKCTPVHATLYCLAEAGITMDEVDVIATSWDPSLDPETPQLGQLVPSLRGHEAFRNGPWPQVVAIPHHLAHAAASYYPSGFDEALIIIADGQGEREATTIAVGRGQEIKIIRQFEISQSIGYFYESVTHYLGLGSDSAGKTMGLAAYGQPIYNFPAIQLTDDGYTMDISQPSGIPLGRSYGAIRRQWLEHFSAAFGPPVTRRYSLDPLRARIDRTPELDDRAKNVAATAQVTIESILLHLIHLFQRTVPCKRVVLGGGVALNCSANGAIWRSGLVDDLYIFPAAHDSGGAIGAALEVAARHKEPCCNPIDHTYWGPAFSDDAIAAALLETHIPAQVCVDIGEKVADLLCSGATVGWFQGRMEIGPRALGHRSILADPTRKEILPHINTRVKGREIWRPLAPSLAVSSLNKVLDQGRPSPFMLQAFQVQDTVREQLPAVTHIDGSTRAHTLVTATSERYHELLQAMEHRIGLPVVLNTSFNDAYEPIVCSPFDALRTFFGTGLDALAIGPFLIKKG